MITRCAGGPAAGDRFPPSRRGNRAGMTEPEEHAADVEQRLAQDLDPERHRAPSEGVPRDLADDEDGELPSS